MNISVVIPLFNEDESLPELFSWIEKVMLENNYSYEIIAVDDGSKDKSWQVITTHAQKNPAIKGIRFQRNYGKSAALQVGFEAAQGDVVITMDADLQDSPDEIPELYKMISVDAYHLVSGWKKKRYDPLTKTIPTKLFNAATRYVSGIHNLHDFNCGLKAYQNKVVKNIEVYGEMHRYIPVIAKWAGFDKITEKAVQHQERKYGVTKFGIERFVNGLLDLMSITFVGKYGKRPMHLFGTLGVLSFFFGVLILVYLTVLKLIFSSEVSLTNRPSFYLAMLTVIVGTQLFVAGFLGELIARNGIERNTYSIGEKINL
ncbi:MAG TPA: glycosyltransferase family 2 protein [Chitinophagales bacterium]|nr:glycosyltransferase family 2 protein [Chitinophagales bacterium]HMW12965.1 glycosyltransferase family 2 protein [Chitinophagales bacterium]HMX61293.1 glycosyltransferase family 2 protein [Chitinophagales bacterium]HMZ33965.1 glycosyltransferase family 2 protein [Chitinophagales bacterium]HNA38838.1 glycosyltransferase family 2 protein [Chitinophagales bacterium]